MKYEITQAQVSQILTLLNQCEIKGIAQLTIMLTGLPVLVEKKEEVKTETAEIKDKS